MAEWTPLDHRPKTTKGQPSNLIRLTPSAAMTISADIAMRFRPHHRVQPLMNGQPGRIGLRGVSEPLPTYSLALNGQSRTSVNISAGGIVKAAGKRLPGRVAVEIPHSWDGDVLVLDLSGLPDAEGVR